MIICLRLVAHMSTSDLKLQDKKMNPGHMMVQQQVQFCNSIWVASQIQSAFWLHDFSFPSITLPLQWCVNMAIVPEFFGNQQYI